MPVYRAYRLVADHIRTAEVLNCSSDEAAIDLARPLLEDADAVEIWERSRMVSRLQGELRPNAS